MNKKQWIALGLWLFVCEIISALISILYLRTDYSPYNPIVMDFVGALAITMVLVCFMMYIGCIICGLLEKETI